MATWTAIFKDPYGNEAERVSGTPGHVILAAARYIQNMIEDNLPCTVEIVKLRKGH